MPTKNNALVLVAAALVFAFTSGGAHSSAQSRQDGQGIPRGADGKPDFSGIWQTLSAADYDLEPHSTRKDAPPGVGIVDGDAIPYQPWALEQRKQNFDSRATADPRTKCFTLGVPRGIYYPEPFQIFQRPRDLTIVHEFGHSVRTIHTNGTQHPDQHIDFWLGDSRGHWEGDALVVDVTHFNDETWLDRAGNFTAMRCTSSNGGRSSTPTPSTTRPRSRTRRYSLARGASGCSCTGIGSQISN
jgi:hypothetical protein